VTVRRMLDAIAASNKGGKSPANAATKRLDLDDDPGEASDTVDPERNPDLDRLRRASPEALYDLFQIMKEAEKRKKNRLDAGVEVIGIAPIGSHAARDYALACPVTTSSRKSRNEEATTSTSSNSGS